MGFIQFLKMADYILCKIKEGTSYLGLTHRSLDNSRVFSLLCLRRRSFLNSLSSKMLPQLQLAHSSSSNVYGEYCGDLEVLQVSVSIAPSVVRNSLRERGSK